MTDRHAPNWGPLWDLVGEELMGDFMWMFEVALTDGRVLHAYKHIDTRRYLHVDSRGSAFAYESPNHYRNVCVVEVLAEVFDTLPGLAGVTAEQVQISRRAVERLGQRSRDPRAR